MDLSTKYLGLALKNPLVVSPSPLCAKLENVKQLEDAGASAIVLHSLFEEQLTADSEALNANLMQGAESFAESLNYFPEVGDYKLGPEEYLGHLKACKDAVDIPVIGSLNGVSDGGWTQYAKQMQEAGADGIELNVYYLPTKPDMTGAQVCEMCENLVKAVKAQVSIPVAVKIGSSFSAIPHVAQQLSAAGADGLVMFNRFYQPDFDLDTLEVVSSLTLSTSAELLLRLRWAAILHGRVDLDLAVTGGVHTAEDVIKSMMAGANVAMMTSALLMNGIGHLSTVEAGIKKWMEAKEYESIEMMQGSMSQKSVGDPAAFERANYLKVLNEYVPAF